jgi:competence CoiA-like predicted nuclease
MLTCKVGENIINTFEYKEKDIRSWSKKSILLCPVCGGKMIYKHGRIKIAHFAHEADECLDKYSEGETQEHLQGKLIIYNWLKSQEGIKSLKLEAWVPETKQRPDIYFEKDSDKFVIEFQCSPIASEYLERRELYSLAGIKDIWILGTEKYNIAIMREKISHSARLKEIEKYNPFYMDVLNKNMIFKFDIISNYLKYRDLSLGGYFLYDLNKMRFDLDKYQVSPKENILDGYRNRDVNLYILNTEKRLAKELSDKISLKIKEIPEQLNKKYKVVNKNCTFDIFNNNSYHYKWKLNFTSDYGNMIFFIKEWATDCCIEHCLVNKRGYDSMTYRKIDSLKYASIDKKEIMDFICVSVSKFLRDAKYNFK